MPPVVCSTVVRLSPRSLALLEVSAAKPATFSAEFAPRVAVAAVINGAPVATLTPSVPSILTAPVAFRNAAPPIVAVAPVATVRLAALKVPVCPNVSPPALTLTAPCVPTCASVVVPLPFWLNTPVPDNAPASV
ncbi:hypothetical protein WG78_07450 [Amantichitinum ursilacus]|uniref:Uncharacterized protein n=1 Tax=Amantichitinum ursilacus TaxID=857265 RepID=A0A0N0GPD0_9NEIS|nr:hypothetical protein WG78_07450 [Amantichitinum ursilacus]